LSLISDAGTPILSDPGLLLIRTCIENNIEIFPLPGPSVITTAVSISGFDDKFLFYGFLPKNENELVKIINSLKNIDFSLVFFLPAVKLNFYLNFFKKYFSGRNILIAREVSKIHETFYRDRVSTIKPFKTVLKGELTVVISKIYTNNESETESDLDITVEAKKYLKKYSLKDVVELISKKEKVSKKKVYEICLKIKNDKKNN